MQDSSLNCMRLCAEESVCHTVVGPVNIHVACCVTSDNLHLQRQDGLDVQLQEAAPTSGLAGQRHLDACRSQQFDWISAV